MTFFDLKQGQDLENWAAHLHQEFQGLPQPPPPQPRGVEPYYPLVCTFSVTLNVRYKYVENK